MKIKGKKAQIQITLTPESVQKARKLGLNISRIAQNALDEAIRRLETPSSEISAKNQTNFPHGAGGGIRTHEPLRDSRLRAAPLTWLGNPRKHKPARIT